MMLFSLAFPLLTLAASLSCSPPQQEDPVMPPDKGEVTTTASGLKYSVLVPGNGRRPGAGSHVRVHYSGWLTNGKLFDSSVRRGEPFAFTIGQHQVIDGWDEGVALMDKGARWRFTIPSELAYGDGGSPPVIPGGATLVFEVELLDFTPPFRPANPEAQEKLESGLVYEVIEPGEGEPPAEGKVCELEFALFTIEGQLLDATGMRGQTIRDVCGSAQFPFMNEALPRMRPGARWRLEVPPELCFGERHNAVTVWEVALVAIHEPLAIPEFKPLDPAKATKTASGLAYEVLEPGTGVMPKMGQNVTVHYAGWLTNGTLFDASYKRSEPATFQLGRVIPGWNEGLQLMKEGAVYRFEIPANLAYGKRGSPPVIPADATLIFLVQLIKVGS